MKPNSVRDDASLSTLSAPRRDAGLMAGSRIMTLRGEFRVDALQPGDRVITRDSGTAMLRAIRRRRIRAPVVNIAARSLGHDRPDRDTILPAGQPVLIRDWRAQALFGAPQALVPAARLVDGEFVTLQAAAPLTLFDLEFDTPHVLYVDGLQVASYTGHNVTT